MSEFQSVTSIGALLPTDLLGRVAAGDRKLEGTAPESYGLVPGERLNDHVTRSWNRLTTVWAAFRTQLENLPKSDTTATTLTRERWLRPLLDELGFAGLLLAKATTLDDKSYAISHRWAESVPLHLLGAKVPIDRRSPGVDGAATTSPHGLVQEFLNRSDEHLWGIVSNGLVLRVLRDNASLTRQAYIEFDLESMFDGERYSDFVLLWLTCHRTRFEGDQPEKCLLEQWSQEAASTGTRALDQLRKGVEESIEALGGGFLAHRANAELRRRLESGELSKTDYQRQLLRLVYRLLFLLVAEARDLLLAPDSNEVARARYREFYSVGRLSKLAQLRRGTAHDDLWDGLGVTMQALWRDGEPALGISPLGSFLWSPEALGDLGGARLGNRHLLEAIRCLTLVRDTEAKVDRSVDYRNLGAEELGSVYESLLELHAQVDLATRTFKLGTAAGNERKTTGSYYTPTSLITELLDSALDPVLDEAAASADPEAAILGLSVLDPACGSGHFLIAAANRIAHRLAGVRAGGIEPAPDEVRAALRDVIGRCIHGIDVNPMAVELCKVSLWIEATEPGKPLSFLDHRIVCGNALLGTTPRLLSEGIPDDAFKALQGDDKKIVTALKGRNKTERKGQGVLALFEDSVASTAQPVADAIAAIDAVDDSTTNGIARKEAMLRELQASAAAERARLAADAWCAAFVCPKEPGEPQITSATVRQLLTDPSAVPADVVQGVRDLAAEYRFLHLHLAFPDVIEVPDDPEAATNERTGWSGGFSAVLGNPPWERVKLQEKEFFAERDPEIAAAPNAAARKRKIAALVSENPELLDEFDAAIRQAEGASHFLRNSGRFPLCGRGDVNTYTVFAESMRNAAGPAGRVGVIVPSGIATDDTTKFFFQDLVERRSLVSLFDFENRKPIFEGVHRSYKFCLLTLAGDDRPVDEAEFVFFALDTADLNDPERRFTLTPADFKLLNPNTRTCPIFRTRRDAEITKGIYQRVPVLVEEGPPEKNPWGVKFQRMFDMSNDSHLFRTREQLESDGWTLRGNIFTRGEERYLPLYEAKMIHHFDHRWATYSQGQTRGVTIEERKDPGFVVLPSSWIAERDFSSAHVSGTHFMYCWRNIAPSTNERTYLPSMIPALPAGNSLTVCHMKVRDPLPLLACASSFVADWACRRKVGGSNLNFFIVQQFALQSPEAIRDQATIDIAATARELLLTSWDISLAYNHQNPYRWDDERRHLLRAELDAAFFHLYGIERDDVNYMMDTFPIVQKKDEAEFGEYRTKRLILEIYDRMAEAIAGGERYQTILDPPPADPSLCHDPSTRPDWADLYLPTDQSS